METAEPLVYTQRFVTNLPLYTPGVLSLSPERDMYNLEHIGKI